MAKTPGKPTTPARPTISFGMTLQPQMRFTPRGPFVKAPPTPPRLQVTTAQRLASHTRIQRVGNGKAEIFIAPDFLTSGGCLALCDLIEAKRRPSTIANANGDNAFRTSETSDMDPLIPVVSSVQNAICGLLGIDRIHAEPLQGQRYSPGQQFKAHTDYFEPGSRDYEKYCSVAGQRTWTAMAYLDEPEAGGHTVFAALDLDVTPKTGMLLLWNNLLPDGTPNVATMHHATPVEAGVKRVITQWYRERKWG